MGFNSSTQSGSPHPYILGGINRYQSSRSHCTWRVGLGPRFIVLDQWRWDFTGLDDAKIHMPTVKQLASEGLAWTVDGRWWEGFYGFLGGDAVKPWFWTARYPIHSSLHCFSPVLTIPYFHGYCHVPLGRWAFCPEILHIQYHFHILYGHPYVSIGLRRSMFCSWQSLLLLSLPTISYYWEVFVRSKLSKCYQ